jgi:protein HOOK3
MEESVQKVIMEAIQELMACSSTGSVQGSGPDADPQLQRILEELEAAVEARDQMTQRCHELDMQVCTGMRNYVAEQRFCCCSGSSA